MIFGLGLGFGNGLFQHDVLSRLGRLLGGGEMIFLGHADIDSLNILSCSQLRDGLVIIASILGSYLASEFLVGFHNGKQIDIFRLAHCKNMRRANTSNPGNRHVQSVTHSLDLLFAYCNANAC